MTKKAMSAIEPNECRHCRHFRFGESDSAMTGDSGECHRYPMQVIPDGEGGITFCWTPAFPDDSCGEFARVVS
jgi:hypothetical protein